MKLLIVEDDPNKSRQITEYLESEFENLSIVHGRSYQSGLKACLESTSLDIVVLDMTMPTFDVSVGDKGGRPRIFAGRDILREMQRKGVSTRVIVVTQFETFGEASERLSLRELTNELKVAFPLLFVGSVYYHPSQSDWKRKLLSLIRSIVVLPRKP